MSCGNQWQLLNPFMARAAGVAGVRGCLEPESKLLGGSLERSLGVRHREGLPNCVSFPSLAFLCPPLMLCNWLSGHQTGPPGKIME